MAQYYSKKPTRVYFIGGSKAGHEALVAAQRYGADYSGVVAYYPAASAFAMQMSWGRMGYAANAPDAKMSSAQTSMVKTAVIRACDLLDGVQDGIISNVAQCRSTFKLESLQCKGDAGDQCLTSAQINGLKVATTPLKFDFPLSGGLQSIGPYPVLDGADFGDMLYAGPTDFWGMIYRSSSDGLAKQLSGAKASAWNTFDYRNYRDQVIAFSKEYDAADVELKAFTEHGGKMLLLQGTTDMLVPENLTTQYWNRLTHRHQGRVAEFARYYIQPGFGHGSGDFMLSVDTLAALDRWVEKGEAPDRLIASDQGSDKAGRTRPLCEYPKWPKYGGRGDINSADSFDCAVK